MPRSRKPYPPEFRQQMVELVRAGRTPEELSREYEPTAQSIWNWVRQAERWRDSPGRPDERQEGGAPAAPSRGASSSRGEGDPEKSRGLVRSGDRLDAQMAFEFMSQHRAVYPVAMMCRMLEVSASGYYAWRSREPSQRARADQVLQGEIEAIHERSRATYGVPRVHAELAARGRRVGRKRVARLMRKAGLAGASRRKKAWTTKRDRDARPAPDLVERDFSAQGPDRLWVADITYIPTWSGFLYLAVVLDAWSRRIVGWSMAVHLRTELVLDALDMAVGQRRPAEVIHHSDQGCQYTSIAFGLRCGETGVRPSMGSVADCYDNAMCESFFATLECELLDRKRFRTQAQARMEVFDFIEGWYNPHRRHSGLAYSSPMEYERQQTVRA